MSETAPPKAPYADRRRELKADILRGMATMAQDCVQWEFAWATAERLGLSEATLASIADELCDELLRRAARLER